MRLSRGSPSLLTLALFLTVAAVDLSSRVAKAFHQLSSAPFPRRRPFSSRHALHASDMSTTKSSSAGTVPCSPEYVAAVHRLRTMSSTVSLVSDDGTPLEGSDLLVRLTEEMNCRASDGAPLAGSELDDCIHSLQNLAPPTSCIDWDELRVFLAGAAHLPHKDWDRTMESATKLRRVLLGDSGGLTDEFKQCFHRVLEEGNWEGAASHADEHNKKNKPWAVLVTGVNGIRKTTSIYQPWITDLLNEALVVPPAEEEAFHSADQKLPVGENSFFRQLDHMT